MGIEFYKSCFADKCNTLLRQKYNNIPERKQRDKFVMDYNLRFSEQISRKAVDRWLNPNNQQAPKLETLYNICQFFDCDIDYFLKRQDTKCKATTFIANTLGLSEESIERLMYYKEPEMRTLDSLIFNVKKPDSEDNLHSLLLAMFKYKTLVASENTITTTRNGALGINSGSDKAILQFEPMQEFQKCLNSESFISNSWAALSDGLYEFQKPTTRKWKGKTIRLIKADAELFDSKTDEEKELFISNLELSRKKKKESK